MSTIEHCPRRMPISLGTSSCSSSSSSVFCGCSLNTNATSTRCTATFASYPPASRLRPRPKMYPLSETKISSYRNGSPPVANMSASKPSFIKALAWILGSTLMCSEGAKAGGTREARSSQPALIHPGMSRVRRTGRGRESCWGSTGAKGTTRRWTQVARNFALDQPGTCRWSPWDNAVRGDGDLRDRRRISRTRMSMEDMNRVNGDEVFGVAFSEAPKKGNAAGRAAVTSKGNRQEPSSDAWDETSTSGARQSTFPSARSEESQVAVAEMRTAAIDPDLHSTSQKTNRASSASKGAESGSGHPPKGQNGRSAASGGGFPPVTSPVTPSVKARARGRPPTTRNKVNGAQKKANPNKIQSVGRLPEVASGSEGQVFNGLHNGIGKRGVHGGGQRSRKGNERVPPTPSAGSKSRRAAGYKSTKSNTVRLRRFSPGVRNKISEGSAAPKLPGMKSGTRREKAAAESLSRTVGAREIVAASKTAAAGSSGSVADSVEEKNTNWGSERTAVEAFSSAATVDVPLAVVEASTRTEAAAGANGVVGHVRRRRCPPTVGFVNGFSDIPRDDEINVGGQYDKTLRSKSDSPYTVLDSLIRSLSDSLPSSARSGIDQAGPRLAGGQSRSDRESSRAGTKIVAGRSEGVGGATVDSRVDNVMVRRPRGVNDGYAGQSTRKANVPSPDPSQLGPSPYSKLDPPQKCVSVKFDPNAETLVSCITTDTDAYGPALHGDAAGNMSRAAIAAYLERWVLMAVKHGVLPRELRALLQDSQPQDAVAASDGVGSPRGETGDDRARVGGADVHVTGRVSDLDLMDGIGRNAQPSASWTKYGWKRLDSPSSLGDVNGGSPWSDGECNGSGSGKSSARVPSGAWSSTDMERGVRDVEGAGEKDEEQEEEEEMESVAEALIGGQGRGGDNPDSEWNIRLGGRQGVRRPSRHRLGGHGKGSSRASEESVDSSLGWRVLEAVEERFESRLHPPRIVVIGDVHGCTDELKDLVREVEYWPGDLLLFLGDLVSKGPDSPGAVRIARELGGVTVRGNHEFEVIRWLNVGVLENERAPSPHHKIALNLNEEDGAFIKKAPWYFRCDEMDALFVHAGFVSGIHLTKQNPRMMINMRSFTPDGSATSKLLQPSPWASQWAGPETVFFGHDAERGLQVRDHAMGIDTGCVYGGRLTACVLPDRRLVSVASRAAYVSYKMRGITYAKKSSTASGRSMNSGGRGKGVRGRRQRK